MSELCRDCWTIYITMTWHFEGNVNEWLSQWVMIQFVSEWAIQWNGWLISFKKFSFSWHFYFIKVMKQRREFKPATSSGNSSGRSSPVTNDDILNHGSSGQDVDCGIVKPPRKLRTFSETLRSLDDDILAELNVK